MTTPVLYLPDQPVTTKLHRQIAALLDEQAHRKIAELLDEQSRLASVVVARNLEIADLKRHIAKLEGRDE